MEGQLKTVVDFFEKHALEQPDAVAVKGVGGELSYRELNSWANAIGTRLLENADTRPSILIFQHQDVEMVAAMMGALKACIPFTLSPPLCRRELKDLLSKVNPGSIIVSGDEELEELGVKLINALDFQVSAANLGLKIEPDATAHLGNTSGTTGPPKLVEITHKTELFQSRARAEGTGVRAGDKVSLMRLNSAAAVRDILVGLTSGAGVYIQEIGQEDILKSVADWIVGEEISILFCHAPIFQRIALSKIPCYPSVRVLQLCGGLSTKGDFGLYKKYFTDDCLFINRYGLTETGTATWLFASKRDDFEGNNRSYIPVGKRFPGAEVWLEGEEILVASDYLSMYWMRPDLNTAKFFKRPEDGKPVYRTGDKGSYDKNGNLVHWGKLEWHS